MAGQQEIVSIVVRRQNDRPRSGTPHGRAYLDLQHFVYGVIALDAGFGRSPLQGDIFLKARCEASSSVSAPTSSAVSMNRFDCSGSSGLVGLRAIRTYILGVGRCPQFIKEI